MSSPNRVFKAKVPARVIVSAVAIGLFVVGFIIFAVWQSGRGLHEARMSGTIVAKEFKPYAETERQITLNRKGAVSARDVEGDYIIRVDVIQKDGTKKTFIVDLNDKARFDAVKVGDEFDVGPYVIPSK